MHPRRVCAPKPKAPRLQARSGPIPVKRMEREWDVFKRIMVPVDLTHIERLDAALKCAADLAGHWSAKAVYVGVTAPTPSKIAHNPKEYGQKLSAFAEEQGKAYGIDTEAHPVVSHDPTADLDDALMKAVGETKADMVVMQSHLPDVVDYIWPSNGGKIAEHAKVSVLVVRA